MSGGLKSSIFGKGDALCLLVTIVLRFALLPYCRRYLDLGTTKNIISLAILENTPVENFLNKEASVNGVHTFHLCDCS